MSVCPSVTLRYCGHTGWNSWEIILWLISPAFSSLYRPQHHGSTPKGSPQILAGIGLGYGKIGSGRTKPAISPSESYYIKSYTGFRLSLKCMSLNDLQARFKVIDFLNVAKMTKYSLIMTPTPCTVARSIISIRPTYACARALTYLLTYT